MPQLSGIAIKPRCFFRVHFVLGVAPVLVKGFFLVKVYLIASLCLFRTPAKQNISMIPSLVQFLRYVPMPYLIAKGKRLLLLLNSRSSGEFCALRKKSGHSAT